MNPWFRPEEARKYAFRMHGTAVHHCSYCPVGPHELCVLGCSNEYDKVVKERESEGVIVNDNPDQGQKA